MDKVDELIFLHQVAAPCHLAILAESIGLKVRVVRNIEELEPEKDRHCFYLIAQKGAALDSKGIPLIAARLVAHVPVALYQVDRDSIDASAAILLGIRGVLYNDQRMDLLLTGLRKMLADELWFDRALISKMFRHLVKQVESSENYDGEMAASVQQLTNREKTIIQLVSSGARNKEIADRLCISEHTVKAHISSIFRKTKSRNRVELLRWAQTYQSHFSLSK